MKKSDHYCALKNAGLPVPLYHVFDSSFLRDKKKENELRKNVDSILKEGSGLIGVRTEAKGGPSPLGNYPHYMPLKSFHEVKMAVKQNEQNWPQHEWWYLVNEAFLDYEWNAVIKLTQEGTLPGHWQLDGEVNTTDNLPLRPALNNSLNVFPARKWRGFEPANLRKMLIRAGLLETWIEVSNVHTRKGNRLIFWGMRNVARYAKK